jgi:hypothetical protein
MNEIPIELAKRLLISAFGISQRRTKLECLHARKRLDRTSPEELMEILPHLLLDAADDAEQRTVECWEVMDLLAVLDVNQGGDSTIDTRVKMRRTERVAGANKPQSAAIFAWLCSVGPKLTAPCRPDVERAADFWQYRAGLAPPETAASDTEEPPHSAEQPSALPVTESDNHG